MSCELAGESLAGKACCVCAGHQESRDSFDSRVHAGSAVVDALRLVEHKPRLVVQASAVSYYGPRGSERITEADGAGTDFMSEICVNWEASTVPVETFGVRRVVIRLGIVLVIPAVLYLARCSHSVCSQEVQLEAGSRGIRGSTTPM